MEEKSLYVFDMDDTLVQTPCVSDIFKIRGGRIFSGDHTIDRAISQMIKLFKKAFKETDEDKKRAQELAGIKHKITFQRDNKCILMFIDKNLVDANMLQKIQDSPNLEDSEKNKILKKFDICGDKVALGLFSEIFQTESTIGTIKNSEIIDIYKRVENKMIVTGRNKNIQKGTEHVLFSAMGVNLPEPNFGLHLFPGGNINGGIKGFKANVVIDSIIENGWTKIYYFDDRGDWLQYVKKTIENRFPKVKVYTRLIKC